MKTSQEKVVNIPKWLKRKLFPPFRVASVSSYGLLIFSPKLVTRCQFLAFPLRGGRMWGPRNHEGRLWPQTMEHVLVHRLATEMLQPAGGITRAGALHPPTPGFHCFSCLFTQGQIVRPETPEGPSPSLSTGESRSAVETTRPRKWWVDFQGNLTLSEDNERRLKNSVLNFQVLGSGLSKMLTILKHLSPHPRNGDDKARPRSFEVWTPCVSHRAR